MVLCVQTAMAKVAQTEQAVAPVAVTVRVMAAMEETVW
jgi:hypothetical protein